MIEVWCDGACEPYNPGGWGGYGAVIRKDGKTIREISGVIQKSPETSNNVAEYRALVEALTWLAVKGMAEEAVIVRGDSRLVIQQMFGAWKIKAGFYAPLARQCKTIVARFPKIRGEWIPREKNSLADELSKRELKKVGVRFKIQPESESREVVETIPVSAPARHSWEKSLVEVEWDSLPRHLYTCRRCGMKKQSVPTGHFYVPEFTAPDGTATRGKTPPCLGAGQEGGEPTARPSTSKTQIQEEPCRPTT